MPGVLISRDVEQRYGDEIRRITGPAYELAVATDGALHDGTDLAQVVGAFLSTDLWGSSSKTHPGDHFARFAQTIAMATSLRWLHTCSAGADRDVFQQAMRRGVLVTTSSGANAQAVAHTAIAGLLALARGVPDWVAAQARRSWTIQRDGQAPRDIDGTHALVVGMGPIGLAIAKLCKALGMRVTGVRRQARPQADFDAVLPFADIASVLGSVDWVILACPLTAQTRGMVDQAFIQGLPATACVINVARGEVVVDIALQQALDCGRLAGCYSDVFAQEPLPADSPWWTTRNTLVSPHGAASAAGFAHRTAQMFLGNLRLFVQGQALTHVATLA